MIRSEPASSRLRYISWASTAATFGCREARPAPTRPPLVRPRCERRLVGEQTGNLAEGEERAHHVHAWCASVDPSTEVGEPRPASGRDGADTDHSRKCRREERPARTPDFQQPPRRPPCRREAAARSRRTDPGSSSARNAPRLITTRSMGGSAVASPACRPATTPATSPSPKLDSTPPMCTSASGHSWAMIPAMNVPWPASKSSDFVPSSSGSSSSSMGIRPDPSGWASRQPVCTLHHSSAACSGRRTPPSPSTTVRSPVSRTRICGRRRAEMFSRRRRNRGSLGRLGRRQQHLVAHAMLVGLGLDDAAEKSHLAGPRCRSPKWIALHDLLAEDHVVQLAVDWWIEAGEIPHHRLRSSERPTASRR